MIRLISRSSRRPGDTVHKTHGRDHDGQPLRVLMLMEGWTCGGTERYVETLTRYLKLHENCDVHLGLVRHFSDASGIGLPTACGDPRESSPRHPFASLRDVRLLPLKSLRKLLADLDPDVCHCHLYSGLLKAVTALRLSRARRIVATFHMPLDAWNWRRRLMWQASAKLIDHAVFGSHATARSFGYSAGTSTTSSVIPPAIPSPDPEAAAGSGRPNQIFTVCGVGRLTAEKDWPTLVRAFATLHQRRAGQSRLVLAGGGPMESELRSLVLRLGTNDHVEMPGVVDRAQVLAMLQGCDVFVLPSKSEGMGIAALEAMQCGVPTITADFDASSEYIEHGVTGHRFPRGSSAALSELLTWHAENLDASRAMGQRGRAFVGRQFSEQATFARQMGTYLGR